MDDLELLWLLVRVLVGVVTGLLGWVGFSIYAIMRGTWVPRRTHERELRILTEQHAAVVKIMTDQLDRKTVESNEWHAGAESWESVAREALDQNRTMLEQNKTTVYALGQIGDAAQAKRGVSP